MDWSQPTKTRMSDIKFKNTREILLENSKLKEEVERMESEMRDYSARVREKYGWEAEELEPQYYRYCHWCKHQQLHINENIFIYEKEGEEEKVLCHDCGEPNPYKNSPYSQLKRQGYTCDEDEED